VAQKRTKSHLTGWKPPKTWPSAGPKPWSSSVGVPTNVFRKPRKKGFRNRTTKGFGT
jgi:hypothetical protein